MTLGLALAAVLLPASAPGQQIRDVWADAFSVGFKSTSQINDLVNRCVAGRYNVIIAEVLAFHDTTGGGHGAYWNSSIVPKALDITGNIDPLAVLTTQAHAAGLQVHAWIVPYRVSSGWPPAGNALLAAHPEWLMVPQAAMGGGPATVGGYYTLDPGSPDAQEYLTSIVQELVANYPIDGINLDYIRYVDDDAGYPAVASYQYSSLERFKRLTGFVGTPPFSGNTSWNDFRRQTITEYVKRLRAEIPSIPNPRQPLWLSADLIAFGDAPANFNNSDAYALFQNWRLWMEQGWLDCGIPMNYKREHIASQATWYRNWVNASLNWRYNRYMVSGQGNYLNTKANSVTQMAYAINAGTNGCCNFSYDATADENTNGTPETDWTWYTHVASNLYTAATTVPTLPWRNPTTASEGTLWGRVADADTDVPVDGAVVTFSGRPAVTTDGNGYFVITLIPATAAGVTGTLTVTNTGCATANVANVAVFAGGISRRDVGVCVSVQIPGDMDLDGDVDASDRPAFLFCLQGPDNDFPAGSTCRRGDSDGDADVDALDLAAFQVRFGQ
jgi:uncharacterized lipoprotein YddW (UPF0748 family)